MANHTPSHMDGDIEIFEEGERLGWVLHVQPTTTVHEETKNTLAALDVYCLSQDGSTFRVNKVYRPYFYLIVKEGYARDVEVGLQGAFSTLLADVEYIEKEDLDMPNHLSGQKRQLLKLIFFNVSDLCQLRDVVKAAVQKNAVMEDDVLDLGEDGQMTTNKLNDRLAFLDSIMELREFDVKYHVRVAIDLSIRVGLWYKIEAREGSITFSPGGDILHPTPKICAFDIECAKAPLKFPDAEVDPVYMISYMLDTQGYLIINREIVGEDIADFEYTPKPEYEGPFICFNEPDEEGMLRRWVDEMKLRKPNVFVTFNGDFFDWPYLANRCKLYGIDFREELGFAEDNDGQWVSPTRPHIDCLYWVKRDSYLPQGSHGLKAVTKYKLGYEPLEINPEDMLSSAQEEPQTMANYSVSDAVATYYLYMKYIHPFVFSLCTIIPMPPDEVLRKGSGTCCETLLMVQAYAKNIVFPNKEITKKERFHNNHLLESETYIGGHVEAFRSGVFRSDLSYAFNLDPEWYQMLIDKVDGHLKFTIEVEGGLKLEEVTNYEEIKQEIVSKLAALRDVPKRMEEPLIYHLDVGAMYPNIILTNRLQPPSMVHEEDCAACTYNRPENKCQRQLNWVWRGEYFMANKSEYQRIKQQLETESIAAKQVDSLSKGNMRKQGRYSNKTPGGKDDWRNKKKSGSILDRMGSGARGWGNKKKDDYATKMAQFHQRQQEQDEDPNRARRFHELGEDEQFTLIKKRLSDYSRKVYRKIHGVQQKEITATVCQRENPFFVDTVRDFRDRRYVYKGLTKKWAKELGAAKSGKSEYTARECASRVVLNESLQLAHKCILNSFYGYVMRKGSRWYSMEMGGVVTHNGANIIKRARDLSDHIGISLELDTDGIWCCLPKSFPENFTFTTSNPKKSTYNISYPCCMLNADVYHEFTNHQYQDWDPEKREYVTKSDCSIFFEVDGPYLCMTLPASREENKSIKKRYAVFNHDKSLAELKGFEIKRRGELKLIKVFQAEVFPKFLEGKTLQECYAAVGKVCDEYLDVLYTKGAHLDTAELMDLIVEARNMSGALSDYAETQKSLSLTTARRLAEFLGPQMVKDKGLACSYVVAKKPEGEPVATRGIPTLIFNAEPKIQRHFLAKWLRDPGMTAGEIDVRDFLDWDYYIERLNSAIQKIVTIPAAYQNIPNPVPRVRHPSWLQGRINKETSRYKQAQIRSVFKPVAKTPFQEGDKENLKPMNDIEDVGSATKPPPLKKAVIISKGKRGREVEMAAPEAEVPPVSLEFRSKYFSRDALTQDMDAAFFADSEFPVWLLRQKGKWRAQVEARRVATGELPTDKRTRSIANNRDMASAQAGKSLASYLDGARGRLISATWTVLQIRPTHDLAPGILKAFVLLDGTTLQTVKVVVPRLIYVNARTPLDVDQLGGRLVSYTLPRRKQAFHLYELEFSEAQYNADLVTNLSLMTEVEGVYERNVSLQFRANLQVGAVCHVDQSMYVARLNSSATPNPDVVFLSEIQIQPEAPMEYLKEHALQPVYVYHITSEMDNRGIIGVFFAKQRQVRVCVIQPPTVPQLNAAQWVSTTQAIVSRTQTQATQNHSQWHPDSGEEVLREIAKQLEFEFLPAEYDSEKVAAFKRVDGWLAEYYSVARPSVVFFQGFMDPDTLAQSYIPILNNVPIKTLQCHQGDHQIFKENVVGSMWINKLLARMMEGYSALGAEMDSLVSLSRFANVPMCNVEVDKEVFLIDVVMARMLRKNSHLLWNSNGSRPDLGGTEGDDNKFASCDEILGAMQPIEVNSGGAYHTYSVEFEINNLEVLALVFSQAILDQDAHALQVQQESSQVLSVFTILRELVSNWYADVVKLVPGCEAADALLLNVFRWLRNKNSMLYDPALHRFTLQLVKKAFTQLLQRMLKVGSRIIYANFHKVIVNTPKVALPDTLTYISFLLSTLKESPIHKNIQLTPSLYYTELLWVDKMNHVGMHLQRGINPMESNGELSEGPFEGQINLAMAEYLPEDYKVRFGTRVGSFLMACCTFKTDLLVEESKKPIADQASKEAILKLCEDFSKTLVEGTTQRGLLEDVEAMRRNSQIKMPSRPGSELLSHDPAREYVKTICHLFELEPRIASSVHTMKRNLLSLIGLKPFDQEAQYIDPTRTFTLSDVVCPGCTQVMDIDLVRDTKNFPPNAEWVCCVPGCRHIISREMIESQLVEYINMRIMSYQVQDLQCVKCKQVKPDNLASYCSCSGEYKCKEPKEAMTHTLQSFVSIAKYHSLPWLLDSAEWALQVLGEAHPAH